MFQTILSELHIFNSNRDRIELEWTFLCVIRKNDCIYASDEIGGRGMGDEQFIGGGGHGIGIGGGGHGIGIGGGGHGIGIGIALASVVEGIALASVVEDMVEALEEEVVGPFEAALEEEVVVPFEAALEVPLVVELLANPLVKGMGVDKLEYMVGRLWISLCFKLKQTTKFLFEENLIRCLFFVKIFEKEIKTEYIKIVAEYYKNDYRKKKIFQNQLLDMSLNVIKLEIKHFDF
ncbi:hypothetical protein BpHYR1_008014 [Brachionus plicatilis]|uniref:Uncharacterized protein n=1 Tax=Brachionus plicatilis TaxID=10195 RepID=A0A3M7R488_BRAPC|nr:hypothetical protein BpHYR1_008014 [Brachionus plicatilis]